LSSPCATTAVVAPVSEEEVDDDEKDLVRTPLGLIVEAGVLVEVCGAKQFDWRWGNRKKAKRMECRCHLKVSCGLRFIFSNADYLARTHRL